MKRLLILSVSIFLLSACTRPEHTVGTLEAAGYTNIKITGYKFFGCSKDDTFHTGFEATGPTGKRVSGVVCSGVMKGSTIRID